MDLTVNLTPSVVSLLGLLSFSEISKTVLVKKICERKKNYIHIYTYYKYLLYALMLTCVFFFFFSSFYRDRCCSYTRVSNLIHQKKKERIGCYNVLAFHCWIMHWRIAFAKSVTLSILCCKHCNLLQSFCRYCELYFFIINGI